MDEMSGLRPEVKIDIKLAAIWGDLSALNNKLDSVKSNLHHILRIRQTRVGRSYVYPLTLATAAAQVEEKIPSMTAWDARSAQETLDKMQDIKDAITAKRIEAQPLEAEFDAKQWSRFFIVNNTNGHIHSSMNCSTCHITTSFGWLPELSGLTERVAVEEHGPILCSVCFPSAPLEWTMGHEKKEDPNKCPGSGKWVRDGNHRRYQTCPDCNTSQNVTQNGYGKFRTHKKEA